MLPTPNPILNLSFKKMYIFFLGGVIFFLGVISIGSVVVPYHKIIINLPGTYEKLPCKRRSRSVQRLARSFVTNKQTDRQTDIVLLIIDNEMTPYKTNDKW